MRLPRGVTCAFKEAQEGAKSSEEEVGRESYRQREREGQGEGRESDRCWDTSAQRLSSRVLATGV